MINAISLYRIARFFYKYHLPFVSKVFTFVIFIVYNCKISYKTKIGKGTFLVYGGIGVLINADAIIGERCSLGVNSAIVGQAPYKHAPVIGNRVFIGPGAIIQGPVIVEDNVIVAPNSVVNKSVPKGAIVAGIPAKIVGWSDELEYDIFKNEAWNDEYADFLVDNRCLNK